MKKLIFVVGLLTILNCYPKQQTERNMLKSQPISDLENYIISPISWMDWEVPEYDITWQIVRVDSNNLGSENCKHAWEYSKEWRAGGNLGCGVYHAGRHCSYDDAMRDRICSKCLRHETQRENWVEKEKPPRKLTPYEKLEEKLRGG